MDEQTQKLLESEYPNIAKSYEPTDNANSVDNIMNRSRQRTNSICSSKSVKEKQDFAKNAVENFDNPIKITFKNLSYTVRVPTT